MIGDSAVSVILQKALDGTWQKQRAIANNIANYETPGYKSVKVSFEDSLDREIQKLGKSIAETKDVSQNLEAIKNSKISVFSDNSTIERTDGNNVNLELENIEMAKAQIQYQYLTRSMTDMYARMRYAISEGRK